jgi:hypothetical protein
VQAAKKKMLDDACRKELAEAMNPYFAQRRAQKEKEKEKAELEAKMRADGTWTEPVAEPMTGDREGRDFSSDRGRVSSRESSRDSDGGDRERRKSAFDPLELIMPTGEEEYSMEYGAELIGGVSKGGAGASYTTADIRCFFVQGGHDATPLFGCPVQQVADADLQEFIAETSAEEIRATFAEEYGSTLDAGGGGAVSSGASYTTADIRCFFVQGGHDATPLFGCPVEQVADTDLQEFIAETSAEEIRATFAEEYDQVPVTGAAAAAAPAPSATLLAGFAPPSIGGESSGRQRKKRSLAKQPATITPLRKQSIAAPARKGSHYFDNEQGKYVQR